MLQGVKKRRNSKKFFTKGGGTSLRAGAGAQLRGKGFKWGERKEEGRYMLTFATLWGCVDRWGTSGKERG